MQLGTEISSPAILRPDPPLWLRERGLIRCELAVYHPSAEHTTFRKARVEVDEDGIRMPLRRPVSKGRATHIAEALIELHERGLAPIYLPCFDAELYEHLVAPTLVFFDDGVNSDLTTEVPADWNSNNNFVDCIGPGGGSETQTGQGGGGGAWSRKIDLALTPGSTVTYRAGKTVNNPAENPGKAWFNGTTFGNASVAAEGGKRGGGSFPSSIGGRASVGIGDQKFSGGKGGPASGNSGGAGGGAAGPDDDGGDSNGTTAGIAGGSDTEYDATHGCGRGGGGGLGSSHPGNLYGGGAGAGKYLSGGAAGAVSLIVLFYTPSGGNMMLMF